MLRITDNSRTNQSSIFRILANQSSVFRILTNQSLVFTMSILTSAIIVSSSSCARTHVPPPVSCDPTLPHSSCLVSQPQLPVPVSQLTCLATWSLTSLNCDTWSCCHPALRQHPAARLLRMSSASWDTCLDFFSLKSTLVVLKLSSSP